VSATCQNTHITRYATVSHRIDCHNKTTGHWFNYIPDIKINDAFSRYLKRFDNRMPDWKSYNSLHYIHYRCNEYTWFLSTDNFTPVHASDLLFVIGYTQVLDAFGLVSRHTFPGSSKYRSIRSITHTRKDFYNF